MIYEFHEHLIKLICLKIKVHSVSISIWGIITLNKSIHFESQFLVEVHSCSSFRINMKGYPLDLSCSAFVDRFLQQCFSKTSSSMIFLHYFFSSQKNHNNQSKVNPEKNSIYSEIKVKSMLLLVAQKLIMDEITDTSCKDQTLPYKIGTC